MVRQVAGRKAIRRNDDRVTAEVSVLRREEDATICEEAREDQSTHVEMLEGQRERHREEGGLFRLQIRNCLGYLVVRRTHRSPRADPKATGNERPEIGSRAPEVVVHIDNRNPRSMGSPL